MFTDMGMAFDLLTLTLTPTLILTLTLTLALILTLTLTPTLTLTLTLTLTPNQPGAPHGSRSGSGWRTAVCAACCTA